MKKEFFVIFLSLVLLFSLAACGGHSFDDNMTDGSDNGVTQQPDVKIVQPIQNGGDMDLIKG